jgi:hypothetical protein
MRVICWCVWSRLNHPDAVVGQYWWLFFFALPPELFIEPQWCLTQFHCMWSVLQSGFWNLDLAGEWSNSECRYTDSPSPRRTSRGRTRSRTPPRRSTSLMAWQLCLLLCYVYNLIHWLRKFYVSKLVVWTSIWAWIPGRGNCCRKHRMNECEHVLTRICRIAV